jgi:hypothetical protein
MHGSQNDQQQQHLNSGDVSPIPLGQEAEAEVTEEKGEYSIDQIRQEQHEELERTRKRWEEGNARRIENGNK